MKLLILAWALTAMSCRDDPGSGGRSATGARHLPEEPSGALGTAEREATLETRRPAEEPVVTAGKADERENRVPHGDDDNTGSQDRFQRWSLSEEPTLVIGGADERERYLLHRVVGAARLDDGRIVVLNEGSLQLKYYDPEGKHLHDAGGPGEGPGELQPPLSYFTRLPGDSILVASWRSGFVRFGPDGRYASSIPYELPPRGRCWQFEDNDLLPDGSFLLRYSGITRFTDTHEPCPEPVAGRPPVVIGRFVPATAMGIDTLAVLPGAERTGDPSNLHAYQKDLVVGIAPGRIYLGDTGSDTILVMNFRGDTIGALPVPFESAPVPADAREKAFEDGTVNRLHVSDAGERLTTTERRTWTFIYGDHYPRYARLVAAPRDRVWVMAYPPLKMPAFRFELTSPTASRRLEGGAWWKVLDRDGLVVAELRTPPGFFLLEVGDDHVLGLHKDEFDRESVRLYRLIG